MKANMRMVTAGVVALELSQEEAKTLLALIGRVTCKGPVGELTTSLYTVLRQAGVPMARLFDDAGDPVPVINMNNAHVKEV